jgi:hypothetical protein
MCWRQSGIRCGRGSKVMDRNQIWAAGQADLKQLESPAVIYGWIDPSDVVGTLQGDWGWMAEAYKSVGDDLIDRPETATDSNLSVFAVCYAYRQYLELRLKEVIDLLYLQPSKEIKISHNLLDLWDYVQDDIRFPLYGEDRETVLKNIRDRISEIADFDTDQNWFRYPYKSDWATFPPITSINLTNLKRSIDALNHQLVNGVGNAGGYP